MLLIYRTTDGQAKCTVISLLKIVCYLPAVHWALKKNHFDFSLRLWAPGLPRETKLPSGRSHIHLGSLDNRSNVSVIWLFFSSMVRLVKVNFLQFLNNYTPCLNTRFIQFPQATSRWLSRIPVYFKCDIFFFFNLTGASLAFIVLVWDSILLGKA